MDAFAAAVTGGRGVCSSAPGPEARAPARDQIDAHRSSVLLMLPPRI
jgi:hypothetical protein